MGVFTETEKETSNTPPWIGSVSRYTWTKGNREENPCVLTGVARTPAGS
jgi:hypothetical protein